MGQHITKRAAALLLADVAATYGSYWLASLLTNVEHLVFVNNEILFVIGILTILNVLFLGMFKLYNNLWEYASIDEAIQIVGALGISSFLGAVLLWILGIRLPIRVFVAAYFLLVIFAGSVRLLQRVLRQKKRSLFGSRHCFDRPRTLIVGAGETGGLTIQRMNSKDPLIAGIPVCVVDDNPSKRNLRIHGIKVIGSSEDIPRLAEEFDVEQIVVAIPSAKGAERRRIYDLCTQTPCKLKTLPNIRELSVGELDDVKLRDVEVNDLLGREEVVLNTRLVSGYIAGDTILVTGGGGSIGSELCRQLCTFAPAHIIIFDMYENDAYMLRQDLLKTYNDIKIDIEIGNVCDEYRLNEVFDQYKPSVVFHAAAHKHVPLMEMAPRESIQNNVFGTLNAVRAADAHGVKRFIFISTDKAVNPTSVMGATKRMGEMVMQYYARISSTVYTAVRFGNVLGSNGSVIPVFTSQIKKGGPVTVTHPDIERYFMTIPEAARLVIQAGGMAKGGEIFILDMGSPVKIVDLAQSLIRLSGLVPHEDIEIVFTGLREGEKLYEELLMDDESTLPTDNASIMISTGQEISYDEVAQKIDELKEALTKTDAQAIELLQAAVPTYTYTPNH